MNYLRSPVDEDNKREVPATELEPSAAAWRGAKKQTKHKEKII